MVSNITITILTFLIHDGGGVRYKLKVFHSNYFFMTLHTLNSNKSTVNLDIYNKIF